MTPQEKVDATYGNPVWRLNNLYSVVDKKGHIVPFRCNGPQSHFLENMHTLNIILKARQLGFSTFIQLYMLDACIWGKNIGAGVIAHTREDAEIMFNSKIKFPYENIDEEWRETQPATQDSARTLRFKDGSEIRVGTSLRGGTLQYLHISEYGKICAQYPKKAREVKTGALNTVQRGQRITIESTAEGQEGHFYELCQAAMAKERKGETLTDLDFKFFFFPWFEEPDYILIDIDFDAVIITSDMKKYFNDLRLDHGIELSDAQKAWYVKKAEQQGEDMKREYPSTPEEAFEASVEGAYYGQYIAKAEEQGRITSLAHDPHFAVETWWDLGIGGSDTMSIIWVQRVGNMFHVIDYYTNGGEGLAHYANILKEKQDEGKDYTYSHHIWPHDGNTRILDEKGRTRAEVFADLGYQVEIVPRGATIQPGIEACRGILPRCKFDEERCSPLVKALKSYRKEWDEDKGVFSNKPRHDSSSHPSDAFRTGAMYDPPSEGWSDWEGEGAPAPDLGIR